MLHSRSDEDLRIERSSLRRLEESLAPGRKWRRAWLGLGVGAVAGALIGFSSGDDGPGILSLHAEQKAALAALIAPGEPWGELDAAACRLAND